jgi:hypothetical protein
MSEKFNSPQAHIERLTELLKWVESNLDLQTAIKNKHNRKATDLLMAESTRLFGSSYARPFAKVIIAKLKAKTTENIHTKWGWL